MLNNRKAAAATTLGLTSAASQAAVDVTALTGAVTDIAAVGVAVFAVYVAIHLTKWVRRAL